MKTINIIRSSAPRNNTIQVDDEDYEKISKLKLYVIKDPDGYLCVMQGFPFCSLGHILIGSKLGCLIDHIDRNTFNFSRANLRHLTYHESGLNKGLNKNNTSGYKGVSYHSANRRYMMKISAYGVTIRKAIFKTAKEAAIEYDKHVPVGFPTNKSLGLL